MPLLITLATTTSNLAKNTVFYTIGNIAGYKMWSWLTRKNTSQINDTSLSGLKVTTDEILAVSKKSNFLVSLQNDNVQIRSKFFVNR